MQAITKRQKRLLGLVDSLTLEKKGESKALSSSAAQLNEINNILDQTCAAVLTINHKLEISHVNAFSAVLLGFESPKLINMPFGDLLQPKDKDLFVFAAQSFINTSSTSVMQTKRTVKVIRANNTSLSCVLYLKPINDSKKPYLIVTLVDINDFVEVNQAYEERAEEASQANLSKSMFLAKMSHEIRTPLHGVLGSLQIINTISDPEKQKALIKGAIVSGKNLSNIINDIIDLSKIESGDLSYESEPFSLNALIRRVHSELMPQALVNRVELKLSFADNFSNNLKSDETRIGQVIVNLLSNAVKFTKHGVVSCHFEINESKFGSNTLLIKVADSGIGISKIALQSIFEPFRQADNSITRKYGGSGLGLAISKNICMQMGGDLCCSSKLGVGSTFEALIPIEISTSKVLPKQNAANLPKLDLSKFRVLMVEDNDINAEILIHMLSQSGCTVQHAKDGLEAIESYESFAPDIILMDIHMPKIDGITACRVMREQGCNAPILAVTANVMKDDIKLYEETGFNGHVAKPIIKETLFDGMTSLLH